MIENDGNRRKGFWTISVGNVVSWAVILIGFVTWGKGMADRVDQNRDETVAIKRSLDDMTKSGVITTIAEHERRLNALEQTAQSTKEMLVDIRWIKERLAQQRP